MNKIIYHVAFSRLKQRPKRSLLLCLMIVLSTALLSWCLPDVDIDKEEISIVQDQSIHAGDHITLKELGDIHIGAVIQDVTLEKYMYMLDPYDMLVSPAFVERYHLSKQNHQFLFIDYDKHVEYPYIYTRLIRSLEPLMYQAQINDNYGIFFTAQKRVHGAMTKLVIEIIMILLIDVSWLYQMYATRIQRQKREIGIYQAIGMSKRQLMVMLVGEGFIIGIQTILISVLIRMLPQLFNMLSGNTEIHFDFTKSFPIETLWIDFLLYILMLGSCMYVFYRSARKVIKIPMIQKIRYFE